MFAASNRLAGLIEMFINEVLLGSLEIVFFFFFFKNSFFLCLTWVTVANVYLATKR